MLGPITQTLIKRHAQKTTSLNELFESLSRQINNDSQEQQFLNDMHKKYPQNWVVLTVLGMDLKMNKKYIPAFALYYVCLISLFKQKTGLLYLLKIHSAEAWPV